MTLALSFLVVAALAGSLPAQTLNEVVAVGYQQYVPSVVVPGQVVTLFVRSLNVPDADAGVLPLPTSLSGVKVRISIPGTPAGYPTFLPIFKIRSLDFCARRLSVACPATQITVQIPTEPTCVPNGTPNACDFNGDIGTTLNVEVNGNPGQDFAVQLGSASPHLLNYCDTVSGTPGGCWPMVTHTDGRGVNPYQAARPGEELSVWATGLGPTLPSVKTGDPAPSPAPAAVYKPNFVLSYGVPVPATDGGLGMLVFVPVEVAIAPSFAGLAPNYVGLYQINIRLPDTVPLQARTAAGTISTAKLGLSSSDQIIEQVEIYIQQ
jgi:uncharacterized protein (TIGR03437 family)